MSVAARLRSESGYSLMELLISSAIMMTITGAIFGLVNPGQGTSQTVPGRTARRWASVRVVRRWIGAKSWWPPGAP